jgi:glucose-6-phosphate isomerase
MRWNDSATGLAAAVQMLTMPVATFSVVVASKSGSTKDNSAGGEPAIQTVP